MLFRKLLIKLISGWKYYRQLKFLFLIVFPPFSLFLFFLLLSHLSFLFLHFFLLLLFSLSLFSLFFQLIRKIHVINPLKYIYIFTPWIFFCLVIFCGIVESKSTIFLNANLSLIHSIKCPRWLLFPPPHTTPPEGLDI